MPHLKLAVGDLVGRPGTQRRVEGEVYLQLKVGESSVTDEALVEAVLEAISDGILVRARASVVADHQCVRCLLEWTGPVEAEFVELFLRSPSEGESSIAPDLTIDLGPIVHDEISLNLPPDPLCRADCAGLCPICGADLNMAPCGGHGDDPDSPFAALKRLLEPES
jgi:uncharacterized protein